MTDTIVPGRFQKFRKTTAEWTSTYASYVLRAGEDGYDTDTRRTKTGDGVTQYSALPYPPGVEIDVVNDLVTADPTAALAAAQGPVLANQIAVAVNTAASASTAAASAASTALLADSKATTATATATAAAVTAAAAAPLASPTFSGTPTAPTQTAGNNTTRIATTAFVATAVAAVGSGLPTTTTFAQAIPFDGYRSMGEQLVSGALAFTVNSTSAVDAGETILSLISNGVNTPTFAGNLLLAGTQGYDNTSGRVNNISFFREFGRYYYGVVLGPIIAVPTLVSAGVANATPSRIDLTWSIPMSSTISAAAAFAVSSGHTLSAHTYVDSTHTYLTTSTPFANGEAARTLSYTQPVSNKMTDAISGNLVVNFSGTAITNNVGDSTAPTVVSRTVENATPTVVDVVFSEALVGYPTDANLPAASAFTVSGRTVSTVTWGSSAARVKVTVTVAFAPGDTRTLAYTQPGTLSLADASANKVANFSGAAITNNTTSVVKVRMNVTVGANVVESGDGTAGWNYRDNTGTAVGAGASQIAFSTKTLGSGVDGYIRTTLSQTNANGSFKLSFGFFVVGSTTLDNAPYGITIDSDLYKRAGAYVSFTGGSGAHAGDAQANGHMVQVRRTGSTIVAEYSSDSGGSWLEVHTWASASIAALVGYVGVGVGRSAASEGDFTATDIRSDAMT